MFKVKDTIVYPIYGCGIIKKITTEEINNQKSKYFLLEFPESNVSISIPVAEAEKLGLRKPLKRNEVKEKVKPLWKKVKITQEQIDDLENISKTLLHTGDLSDAVELVNLIKALERGKKEQNKSLSFSDDRNLQSALDFIRSEVVESMGKKAAKELKLDIE